MCTHLCSTSYMYVYICVAIHRMTHKGAHLKVVKIANGEVFFIREEDSSTYAGPKLKTSCRRYVRKM